jgi:hypothetical protein
MRYTSSDLALERALRVATEPADIAEIHGQLGRNKKDRWVRSWSQAATPENKARKALDSPLLMILFCAVNKVGRVGIIEAELESLCYLAAFFCKLVELAPGFSIFGELFVP